MVHTVSAISRNRDFQEVTLEREGQVLLHFAAAYGFRNIQNLVQKLKRGRCPYHYVEVMACPSGAPPSRRWRGGGCWEGAGSTPPALEGVGERAGVCFDPSWHPCDHNLLRTGCLNGGGQLKALDVPSRDLLQQVERLYGMVRVETPEAVPGVQELYQQWLQGESSERASRLLHTQYHSVEKASSGLSIRW